jgi:uncharacterized protein YdhG (YjbR/CyaY superfamily)
MSETRKIAASIDEFIADFPTDVQKILEKIRNLIHELAPTAEEAICYGIPTFKLKKKNLVHFAGLKNHIGFYPTPSGIEAFKEKLSNYEFSKGSVQFPLTKPIPYDLIKEIVEFRIKEVNNTGKKSSKKKE